MIGGLRGGGEEEGVKSGVSMRREQQQRYQQEMMGIMRYAHGRSTHISTYVRLTARVPDLD